MTRGCGLGGEGVLDPPLPSAVFTAGCPSPGKATPL